MVDCIFLQYKITKLLAVPLINAQVNFSVYNFYTVGSKKFLLPIDTTEDKGGGKLAKAIHNTKAGNSLGIGIGMQSISHNTRHSGIACI